MSSTNHYALDWTLPHCQFWFSLNAAQSNRIFLTGDHSHDYRLPQFAKATGEAAMDIQRSVNESWGLENPQDLYHQIWRLAHGDVHGKEWQDSIRYYLCTSYAQWEHYLQSGQDEYDTTLRQFADIIAKHIGNAGIRSWDYSRGVVLTRYGVCSGWIEPDHAAYLMNYIAHEARYYYKDWRHYNLGVLLGRITWLFFGKDMEERQRYLSQLINKGFPEEDTDFHSFFKRIRDDVDCPVNFVPWTTALPDLEPPQSLIKQLQEETDHE